MIRVYVALAFQTAISAATYLVAKQVLVEVGALELACMRFGTAAAVYAGIMAARGERLLPPRNRSLRVVAVAVAGLPLNQGLFLSGLTLTSPAHAAIIYALTPAAVMLGARIFLGERISVARAAGIGLAFAGVALVLLQRGLAAQLEPLRGDLLILAAMVCWSAYTIWTRPLAREHGPLASASWAHLAAAALCAPAAAFLPGWGRVPAASPATWAGIAFLVVFTSVIAYLLWSYALRSLTAARVAVFTNLQPVATAALAWAVYGEPVSALAALGGVLVIAGVSLAQRA